MNVPILTPDISHNQKALLKFAQSCSECFSHIYQLPPSKAAPKYAKDITCLLSSFTSLLSQPPPDSQVEILYELAKLWKQAVDIMHYISKGLKMMSKVDAEKFSYNMAIVLAQRNFHHLVLQITAEALGRLLPSGTNKNKNSSPPSANECSMSYQIIFLDYLEDSYNQNKNENASSNLTNERKFITSSDQSNLLPNSSQHDYNHAIMVLSFLQFRISYFAQNMSVFESLSISQPIFHCPSLCESILAVLEQLFQPWISYLDAMDIDQKSVDKFYASVGQALLSIGSHASNSREQDSVIVGAKSRLIALSMQFKRTIQQQRKQQKMCQHNPSDNSTCKALLDFVEQAHKVILSAERKLEQTDLSQNVIDDARMAALHEEFLAFHELIHALYMERYQDYITESPDTLFLVVASEKISAWWDSFLWSVAITKGKRFFNAILKQRISLLKAHSFNQHLALTQMVQQLYSIGFRGANSKLADINYTLMEDSLPSLSLTDMDCNKYGTSIALRYARTVEVVRKYICTKIPHSSSPAELEFLIVYVKVIQGALDLTHQDKQDSETLAKLRKSQSAVIDSLKHVLETSIYMYINNQKESGKRFLTLAYDFFNKVLASFQSDGPQIFLQWSTWVSNLYYNAGAQLYNELIRNEVTAKLLEKSLVLSILNKKNSSSSLSSLFKHLSKVLQCYTSSRCYLAGLSAFKTIGTKLLEECQFRPLVAEISSIFDYLRIIFSELSHDEFTQFTKSIPITSHGAKLLLFLNESISWIRLQVRYEKNFFLEVNSIQKELVTTVEKDFQKVLDEDEALHSQFLFAKIKLSFDEGNYIDVLSMAQVVESITKRGNTEFHDNLTIEFIATSYLWQGLGQLLTGNRAPKTNSKDQSYKIDSAILLVNALNNYTLSDGPLVSIIDLLWLCFDNLRSYGDHPRVMKLLHSVLLLSDSCSVQLHKIAEYLRQISPTKIKLQISNKLEEYGLFEKASEILSNVQVKEDDDLILKKSLEAKIFLHMRKHKDALTVLEGLKMSTSKSNYLYSHMLTEALLANGSYERALKEGSRALKTALHPFECYSSQTTLKISGLSICDDVGAFKISSVALSKIEFLNICDALLLMSRVHESICEIDFAIYYLDKYREIGATLDAPAMILLSLSQKAAILAKKGDIEGIGQVLKLINQLDVKEPAIKAYFDLYVNSLIGKTLFLQADKLCSKHTNDPISSTEKIIENFTSILKDATTFFENLDIESCFSHIFYRTPREERLLKSLCYSVQRHTIFSDQKWNSDSMNILIVKAYIMIARSTLLLLEDAKAARENFEKAMDKIGQLEENGIQMTKEKAVVQLGLVEVTMRAKEQAIQEELSQVWLKSASSTNTSDRPRRTTRSRRKMSSSGLVRDILDILKNAENDIQNISVSSRIKSRLSRAMLTVTGLREKEIAIQNAINLQEIYFSRWKENDFGTLENKLSELRISLVEKHMAESNVCARVQKLIPGNWCIVGLTLENTTNRESLISWRIDKTSESPFLHRQELRSARKDVSGILEGMEEIRTKLKETSVDVGSRNSLTEKDKAKWWKSRFELDKKMGKLLEYINNDWFGTAGESIFGNANDEKNIEHIVLILDDSLHGIPWECIDFLRQKPVSRVPCLTFLLKELENRYFEVDVSSAYYLLNPKGDLNGTEKQFLPIFEELGWEGISGAINGLESNLEKLNNGLESSEIFMFCGHGGGEEFIQPSKLAKLRDPVSLSFLMGCSSGKIKDNGYYGPQGTPYEWLRYGTRAVVANLWDVTDKDIDRFTEKMLDLWVGKSSGEPVNLATALRDSRGVCRMKLLVGAAPVIYGLPNVRVKTAIRTLAF